MADHGRRESDGTDHPLTISALTARAQPAGRQSERRYTMSQVARAAGVHPNTVRLYERIGLLAPIARTAGGYRSFSERDLAQMRIARLAVGGPYMVPKTLAVEAARHTALDGWSEASAGVVIGVFFVVTGLHGIVFAPSISALSGYDGAIVSGTLDFHLLRPRSAQLLVSVARWTPLMGVEVVVGAVVVARALASLGSELSARQIVVFVCAVFMSVSILYSLTLSLASLMFWKADFRLPVHVAVAADGPTGPIPGCPLPGMAEAAADVDRAGGSAHDGPGAHPAPRDLAADTVGRYRPRGRWPDRDEPAVPNGAPSLRKRIELNRRLTPHGHRSPAAMATGCCNWAAPPPMLMR